MTMTSMTRIAAMPASGSKAITPGKASRLGSPASGPRDAVHSDYTLSALFYLLAKLLSGGDRLCFYTEKELGIRSAVMSAFRAQALEERMDLFMVRVGKPSFGRLTPSSGSLAGSPKRRSITKSYDREER